MIRGDIKRTDAVEDKFLSRLINGEASESGYIFYLTNRRADRWKDMRAIVNNNVTNVNKVEGSLIKGLTVEDMRKIVALAERITTK
jgi:hypothetical protein